MNGFGFRCPRSFGVVVVGAMLVIAPPTFARNTFLYQEDPASFDETQYSKYARIERQDEKDREEQFWRYQQQNYFYQQQELEEQNLYNKLHHSRGAVVSGAEESVK